MSLAELEQKDDFIRRHIGPRPERVAEMLRVIGASSLDDLTARAVPASILEKAPPVSEALSAEPMTETEALQKLQGMARQNRVFRSLIGLGYHDTITPSVILRNVLQNPGWYTAYTPYQPEISQGRLEALVNFQQMVMDLTGMDLANASMLDEGTAAAEAMTLAHRAAAHKSDVFLVAADCHPQTIAVIETRAAPLGIKIVTGTPEDLVKREGFGLLLQYPATNGDIGDYAEVVKAAHARGMLVAVATDLLALTLLRPPGEWGADIVLGSAQRFGVPLGFGGPHAAFFAVKDAYKRTMPGRIVGVSADTKGKAAFRLALQTREQHIRREKATSNICTAQVLLANIAGFYAVYHGPEGLKTIATRIHRLAAILAAGLVRLGFEIVNDRCFDTLTVDVGATAESILARARENGINLRDCGDGCIGVSLDEKSTRDEVVTLWQIFSGQSAFGFGVESLDAAAPDLIPENLKRASAYLTHPTFHMHRSETEMLRYLSYLERKDISLNRAMIPLGSCTMKLNATAEMIPISWPEFCDMHPFAPAEQTEGYRLMLRDLERKLEALTGFAAVSLQPNAGAQGEYAGLLVIRAYHAGRGESHRDVCLIPSSAHGTNPASAVMAGMKVVVVACDDKGNIDLGDLKSKAEAHKDALAALMVTYPSTHGVFEQEIREICAVIHDNGGQVYMDGANFNALVGLACPGKFGADVMHMNLHKTFCIPHGGGGPGMGPIGVAGHLAKFLPGNPVVQSGGEESIGAISAAPWGSASILPISWMYISMMGAEGLKRASQIAILNANYISKKLAPHYATLYTGKTGYVAHECIIDTRPFKESAHVTVDDIAKRLMDFGFHAPTMSFPVPGTLMIEPTESESAAELDRFIAALVAIRGEIARVARGAWPQDDNPLCNAPHTLADVAADDWTHPYTRGEAAFPAAYLAADKFWPPVGRIDNVAGDRNLVCSCPPIEDYQNAA
ncbi:MAG: aminomethyl-transferring glycine dehydrogenase [Alphaproteobacteria bacterium]|nr:aminomethyl-transferring glycine dehydrogenase [Alphaproteobacteria bacterium]MDE2336921.1 aminomethyl-transferring glycine dehydrogenase [Alphaproteobacteria bacterium]